MPKTLTVDPRCSVEGSKLDGHQAQTSKKYRNLFYWISQVCKNISSVRHAYVSQRHVGGSERGAESSLALHPAGLARNHLWGTGKG